MRLLLDLGNTRVKWGVADAGGGVSGIDARDWNKRLADTLHEAWVALPPPKGIWAASVVDAAREAQVAAAALARFGQPVTWVRTPREACGIRVAYAEPETMGVDRFLGMVAAHAEGRSPCVLASAGTAMVVDALTGEGRHLGGLIAPGARLMQQSVLAGTARVRPQAPGRLGDAAASTADALASGCWQACAALVDRFAGRMAGALGGAPSVLLGGGDAGTLQPLVEHASTLYPDAVLKGLALWADGES